MKKKIPAAIYNQSDHGFKLKLKMHAVKKFYTKDYLYAIGFPSE